MAYTFDIIGVTPPLTFFNYQHQREQNPKRGTAFLGSYTCTLDAFIDSTEMVYQKPDWDWDEVISTMYNFWLSHEANVRHWQQALAKAGQENMVVARVANVDWLRDEFRALFEA